MPKRLLIYGFCLSLILSGVSFALADDTSSEAESSVLKNQTPQSSYVYDLKNLIKKSRDNIKQVNEKIKELAVLKRNQKREEKAREYYDIATKLTEEGQLAEARAYYEKAVKITEHPEMTGYIRESERRFKVQTSALEKQEIAQQRRLMEEDRVQMERLESHYQTAVSLYKQEKFKESKREFEIVESMYPEYKATRSYLRIVEQDIAAKDTRTLLQEQEEVARQQREAEIARQREKDQWRKEIERKEREREEQIRRQADDVYREALDLYREKHFVDAKEKFQEVEWVLPDYKSTHKYLRRIDRDIEAYQKEVIVKKETLAERQRWEEEVARKKAEEDQKRMAEQKERERQERLQEEAEFVYQAGVALVSQDRYEEAKVKFQEAEQLVPGYKETHSYLARVDEFIDPDGYKERTQSEQEMDSKLSTLYKEGVDALRKQRYGVAKERFEAVMALDPAYQDTENRLAETVNGLAAEAQQRESVARAQALKDLKKEPAQPKSIEAEKPETAEAEKPKKVAKKKKQRKTAPKDTSEPETPASSAAVTQESPAETAAQPARTSRESSGMLPLHRYVSEGTVYSEEDSAKAKPIYEDAVQHFNEAEFLQARSKFEVLENMYPDFKETRNYMIKIEDALAKRRILDAKSSQEQESQLVSALVMQASALYQQIAALADDKAFAGAFRKFRHVERIIASLQAEQERLAAQIQREEDELRKHQEERLRQLMDMERQRREERYHEKAEAVYANALDLYRDRRFEEAKVKFMELEDIVSGYKAAQDYLARIDQDIAEEARRLQIEGEREARLAEIAQKKAREEQLRRLDEEDYERVRQLAEQANMINMEVIQLAKDRQYDAIAQRFTSLQTIFTELQTIKDRMIERWQQWEMTENPKAYAAKQAEAQEGEKAAEAVQTEVSTEEKLEAMKQKWGKAKDPSQVRAEALRRQQAEQIKREEAAKDRLTVEQKRKERDLLKEATVLYKKKDFPGARAKFEELAAMAIDPRPAQDWLARVEEAVLNQQQDAEDQTIRDRQAYIDEHKEPEERVTKKTEEERREEAVLQRLEARKKRMEMERRRDVKRAELQRQKDRKRIIKEQKRQLALERKRRDAEREKYRKQLSDRSGRYAGYAADYDYREALGRGAGGSYGYGQYRKYDAPAVKKETPEDRAKVRAAEQLKEKEERLAETARLAEAKRQAEIIRQQEAAKDEAQKEAVRDGLVEDVSEPKAEPAAVVDEKKVSKAEKSKASKRAKKKKAAAEEEENAKDAVSAQPAAHEEPGADAFAGKTQEELLNDKEFQRMRRQKIKEKEQEQRAKEQERRQQDKLERERVEKERAEKERLAREERDAIARQEAEMVAQARTQQVEKERERREEELKRQKEEELARQKADEEKRQAEEMERQRQLQEKQKAEEEARQAKILQQQKLEEERRLAEEQLVAEKLERQRLDEEKRQAAELERQHQLQEKQKAEEEARMLRQKEEEHRLEELRLERERLAQEQENRRRLEEEKRREKEKLAAQQREQEMLAEQQRLVLQQQIQERQDQLQKERDAIRQQLEAGVEKIYVEAIALYRQKNYTDAMKRFIEIEELWPGYKKTSDYLDRLQKDILEENKRYQASQKQLIPARIPGYADPSPEDCAEESADCHNTFPPKPRQAVISNVLDRFEIDK